MESITMWLEKDATIIKFLGIIITASTFMILWSLSVWIYFGKLVHFKFLLPFPLSPEQIHWLAADSLGEEFIYRALPISSALYLWPKRSFPLIAAVAVPSVIFGLLHPGATSLLVEGMLAVVLSVAYLGAGGYRGKALTAIACSGSIHLIFNLFHVAATTVAY
jgi:membrane protease YdiL (CAAX protease family)